MKKQIKKKKLNGTKADVNGEFKNAILKSLYGRLSYNHKLLKGKKVGHTIVRPEMYDLGIEHAIESVNRNGHF